MRTLRARIGLLLLVALAVPLAGAQSPAIRSVEVRGEAQRAEVAIRGSFAVPEYAVRSADHGRRVIVEVAGAALPASGVETLGSSRLVTSTVASTTARGARLELLTSVPVRYRARAARGRIYVRLDAAAEAEDATPEAPTGDVILRDVHLERRDGRDRVVVELSRATTFELDEESGRLRFGADRIEPSLRRTLRGLPESLVRQVRVRYARGQATIAVEARDGAEGTAIRSGNRIVWMFTRARSGGPENRTVAREHDYRAEIDAELGELTDAAALVGESTDVAAFLSEVPLQVRSARGERRYSGRRIDLDFKDADIHNILRLLAEVGGVNVVTADDVGGTVTIRMRNVPWDQALDVILQAKGLGLVRQGNLIRVAPLATLEAEREAAIARRKQQVQLAPLETRLVPVSYGTASELSPRVSELLSDRGSVSTDERTNVLIVRDIVENLDDVEELVRTLDTQTPQVLIEARIVEATSDYQRDIGIQWGGDLLYSSNSGNPTGIRFPSNVGVAGGNPTLGQGTSAAGLSAFGQARNAFNAADNFAVNLPAIVGEGSGGAVGLSLGSIGGNVNLNIRLSALESNGTVRIISSPRILTLDNQEATIAQGTLIPFSQVSAQGVNTAFQEAKLELTVRPHVTADGSVSMHLKITRDEPDFTNVSVRGDPTILKREAETDLLVPDGNTAVIGGIYTRNSGRTTNQVPFFGDIPVLGVLFQRRIVTDTRNELLIFVTPRIVNRAEALRN
ncbi:MAG: type IV pilus secretin PilQ [Myxococcota bacterium]